MTPQRKNVFQLAENLGMTVAVLMRDMPLSEFCEWMQFYGERAEEADREEKNMKPVLREPGTGRIRFSKGI